MLFNCVICAECFDNISPVSVSPCGHFYHSGCIKEWLARSGTCPECRRTMSAFSVKRVYPNLIFTSTDEANAMLPDLKIKLSEKEREVKSLKSKNEAITQHIKDTEQKLHEVNQTNMELKQQLLEANLKLKEYKQYQKQYHMVESIAAKKDKELMSYQNIKSIVESRSEDVKLILESKTKSDDKEDACKELAIYCSILKRELEQSILRKNQLRAEVRHKQGVDLENGQLRRKYEALKQKFLHLQKENTNSCQPLKVPCHPNSVFLNSSGPSSSVKNETINIQDDSPIAVKFNENKRKIDLIILDNDESPSTPGTSSNTIQHPFFSRPGPISQEGSVTRIGYDGYGGHGSVVMRSSSNATRRIIDSKPKKTFSAKEVKVIDIFYC